MHVVHHYALAGSFCAASLFACTGSDSATAPQGAGGADASFDGPSSHDTTEAGTGPRSDAGGDADPPSVTEGGAPLSPPTCVDVTALPAWRKKMPQGAWAPLASADLANVTPTISPGGSLSGRIDAWNGFAADTLTSRMYLGGAGGHADYAGNEVYSIDMMQAAPAWLIETQPSPASAYTVDTPYYADGRPSPTHTYYTLWFIEGRSKLFRFAGAATWGTGNGGTDRIDSWDPTAKAWDPDGTNPHMGKSPTYEAPTAKNLLTGDVYQLQADNHLYRWTQATNTVTDLGMAEGGTDSFYDLNKSPAVVDTAGGRLLFLSDSAAAANHVRAYDLVTKKWSTAAALGPAASMVTARESQAMAFFDYCMNRIVVKTTSGGAVFAIDPATLTATTLSTSGTAPGDAINGVHTLFQSLPKLGGYAYQPSHGETLYFLATQ